jgi:hypothetical protein
LTSNFDQNNVNVPIIFICYQKKIPFIHRHITVELSCPGRGGEKREGLGDGDDRVMLQRQVGDCESALKPTIHLKFCYKPHLFKLVISKRARKLKDQLGRCELSI